ncbi:MAG TPA: hypothetical protein VM123_21730 [archaeon]|nr:hypothetical protein [archaeon]
MKTQRLPAFVICLILIGVSPKDSGQELQQAFPFIISGAVSANIGFNRRAEELNIADLDNLLAEGRKLFINQCTSCHSSRFVWESGILSSEAASRVADMLAKSRGSLEPSEHRLLVEYLQYKLPLR